MDTIGQTSSCQSTPAQPEHNPSLFLAARETRNESSGRRIQDDLLALNNLVKKLDALFGRAPIRHIKTKDSDVTLRSLSLLSHIFTISL